MMCCLAEKDKSAGAAWATGEWWRWPNSRLHGTWTPLWWSDGKNAECILESSLPFCHWGDTARWGERLIERLACVRMWLLIRVWEGCQSLWLYLPLPSLSVSFSTKPLSPTCSTFTLFLNEWGKPLPPITATTTTTTLQYCSGFFHTVHPRRVQPLPSVNTSPHFPLVSSRWQTHTAAAAPPPPVLLPSSSALLKGKAAVGGASRGEGEGQLNEWQNKDEKVALVWMDFPTPLLQVPFNKCARYCFMMGSDGVLEIIKHNIAAPLRRGKSVYS